jgi:iron complex transport system substrate-binding protein
VKNGRFHSVYHQFYNSPYHFVAMQAFAKWMHPELFADVDPEASMQELHDKFLPIDYSGVFWGSLDVGG